MFRFRLEPLRDLRLRHEQEAAVGLVRAQGEEERARETCVALEAAMVSGLARIADREGCARTVGEMRARCYVVAHLDARVTHAEEEVRAAECAVEARRAEYRVAVQERRVLDRLRERQEVQWTEEARRADLQSMDALALGRFVREVGSVEEGSA